MVLGNVILVVDMVRGFLEEGYPLSCGEAARRVIPNIRDLIDRELAAGSHIIFSSDAHGPEDIELVHGVWPAHCMKGTAEAEIVPELASYVGRAEFFEKRAYSGFSSPELSSRIAELAPEYVIIVGVCTDVCVLHTAADAFARGYIVDTPEDCVASFNEENHQFGLQHLRSAFGVKVPQGTATG